MGLVNISIGSWSDGWSSCKMARAFQLRWNWPGNKYWCMTKMFLFCSYIILFMLFHKLTNLKENTIKITIFWIEFDFIWTLYDRTLKREPVTTPTPDQISSHLLDVFDSWFQKWLSDSRLMDSHLLVVFEKITSHMIRYIFNTNNKNVLNTKSLRFLLRCT